MRQAARGKAHTQGQQTSRMYFYRIEQQSCTIRSLLAAAVQRNVLQKIDKSNSRGSSPSLWLLGVKVRKFETTDMKVIGGLLTRLDLGPVSS